MCGIFPPSIIITPAASFIMSDLLTVGQFLLPVLNHEVDLRLFSTKCLPQKCGSFSQSVKMTPTMPRATSAPEESQRKVAVLPI